MPEPDTAILCFILEKYITKTSNSSSLTAGKFPLVVILDSNQALPGFNRALSPESLITYVANAFALVIKEYEKSKFQERAAPVRKVYWWDIREALHTWPAPRLPEAAQFFICVLSKNMEFCFNLSCCLMTMDKGF